MRIFIKLASYLKWVGLFGFFRFIFDSQLWKILWGFWIFGFFELLFTLPIFIQSLEQLFAMFAIPLKNNPVPSVSNYKSDIKYSLPFKGKWTVVNGGVDKELSHSWSINAQRYAYDFIKLDDKLKSYNGDRKKLENYYCYESDIIAPADGIIVEVSNKCKDSKIMWNNSTDPLIKDIRGNYIVIKHSEYEYSLICHIKPNSFLVKKGDLVKRYQKLAECGNSGNTTEPHIHFHVQNRRGFVSSAGLPIEFKDIKVDKVEDYNRYDSRPIKSDFDYSMYKGKYIHRGQIVSNILE